jgi:hypothetical protein
MPAQDCLQRRGLDEIGLRHVCLAAFRLPVIAQRLMVKLRNRADIVAKGAAKNIGKSITSCQSQTVTSASGMLNDITIAYRPKAKIVIDLRKLTPLCKIYPLTITKA